MTHAQVEASFFVEEEHPRAQGGQFGTKSSTKPAKKAAPAKKRGRTRRVIPAGQLGFDGVRGTGYGMKGGDARVRSLQAELNRLGLTDMHGRRLAVDGKLGPLTTSAIRKAQRRLGMKATGIIDPSFIARLRATKSMPKAAPLKKAAPRNAGSRVRARFDPDQLRDTRGRWTDDPTSAVRDAVDAIRQGADLLEEFGDERGAVSRGRDGVFRVHSLEGGRAVTRVSLSDEDSLGALGVALEEGDDGSGDGWHLSWDSDGALLAGDLHDDAGMRLSREDAYGLAVAIGDLRGHVDFQGAPDFTAPLGPGERLVGRRREMGPDYDEFGGVMATVETPDGPHVRLGAIAIGSDGVKQWTGGRGNTTVDLDAEDGAKVAAVLERFDAAQKERQKIFDRYSRQFDALDERGADPAEFEALGEQMVGEIGGDFEDDFGVERITTPWGTIRLTDVGMNDEANAHDRHVRLEIWPTGMTEAEFDAGESGEGGPDWAWPGSDGYQKPEAKLLPKDVRALVKALAALREGKTVTAAAPVAAAELRGVELARPGKWNLASGPMEITDRHIADAARWAQRKGARPGYMKIGHNDPRFQVGDGEPALGWVENVRAEVDDQGPVLLGDLVDMPEWFAAAAKIRWPYRSIEGWADYTDPDTGERYALVVDGVAVLGVTPPGMTTLKSLRDLPKAVGAAAGTGTRIVASMASAPTAVEEGAGHMDPAITRTALGLAADASDEEVRSALIVAAQSLGGDVGPAQQPVQASLFGDEAPPAPRKPATPPAAEGSWMRVEASAWAAAQERIQRLEAQAQKQREGERDQVIAEAIKAGKFAPARREHWVRLWNADPEGTREVIDGLARNVMPVTASGYSGGIDDEDIDREFASLFPPVIKEANRG